MLQRQKTLPLSRQSSAASQTAAKKPKLSASGSSKLKLSSSSSSKPKLSSSTSSKPKLSSSASSKPKLSSNASFKPKLSSAKSKTGSVIHKVPSTAPNLSSQANGTPVGLPAAQAKDKGVLMFQRAQYLALRTEEDGYFLCQGLQHVYDTTDSFRIRWLVPVVNKPDQYTIGYVDVTQPECIVTRVRLTRVPQKRNTFQLSHSQVLKIERKLEAALLGKQDKSDEPSPPKKQSKPSKAKIPVKRAPKKQTSVKSKAKKPKATKPVKPKKPKLTEAEKRNPNLLLVKNFAIKPLERDPFLDSEENVPYVSVSAHTKLLHRAVRLGNSQLLKKLLNDVENIGNVSVRYSVCSYESPLEIAIQRHDSACAKLLAREMFDPPSSRPTRVPMQSSMMSPEGTGTYNRRSLGIRRIRKLAMSRGSREGNNALLKDLSYRFKQCVTTEQMLSCALKSGVSISWLKSLLKAAGPDEAADVMTSGYEFIYEAIRCGHRELAGNMIEEYNKYSTYRAPFGFLHQDVLLFNGEDLRPFKEASAQKKPYNNVKITPIHCAAINPNVKYLQEVLTVLPEYNIADKENRRPIHYAVACTGTGPLEYLIKRGVEVEVTDDAGFTPLMVACQVGRADNVELLLKHANKVSETSAEKASDSELEEATKLPDNSLVSKYGVGGINRPIVRPNKWNSMCPLHMAVEKGHLDVVEVLIEHDVDVHKVLSPGKDKMTPLIMASRYGQLQIVKLLIQHEAKVEGKDKLGRTPLVHAMINGHTDVASYLLHLGANVHVADTSGNSALHYAVAYGWYFCVKLLLQAGADPNAQNDWKMLPLWVAYMKGHVGLVDLLLRQPGVDINMKDDQGQTLLMMACNSDIVEGLSDQIMSLVKERGALCNVVDGFGNNCLHSLANSSTDCNTMTKMLDKKNYAMRSKNFLTIANLLIEEGCDVDNTNDAGHTPFSLAVSRKNEPLANLLAKRMTVLPTSVMMHSGDNLLHVLARNCQNGPQKPLLDILKKLTKSPKKDFEDMINHVNISGYNPFLEACKAYQDCRIPYSVANHMISVDELNHLPSGLKPALKPALSRTLSNTTKKQEGATVNYSEWRQACAREFLKALLDLSPGVVDSQVKQRDYSDEEDIPKLESQRYQNPAHGKNSALYFMVHGTEEVHVGDDKSPGLTLILQYKPCLLNCYDNLGIPLLQHAVQSSQHNIVAHNVKKLALAGVNIDIAFKKPGKEEEPGILTCIIYAAMHGLDDVVCLMASLGALVSTEGPQGNTALHHVARMNRVQHDVLGCARALLDADADASAENKNRQTPLHLAVQANSGTADITCELEVLLLEEGASAADADKFGRLPLHYVFLEKNTSFCDSAKDPIALCSTLTTQLSVAEINHPDIYQRTALHLAAHRGAGICCVHLIEKGAAIERLDKFGNSPLAVAITAQHQSCVIMLLQKSANFNGKAVLVSKDVTNKLSRKECGDAVDDEPQVVLKWKPLKAKDSHQDFISYPIFQVSVKNEWQGVLFIMLDHLSKVGLPAAATVEAALTTRRYNLAITLLIRFKDFRKLRETNKDGQNLFHILAAKCKAEGSTGYLRIANMLQDRGISLTQKDKYGCTPLHYACLRKIPDLVMFIFDHCADNGLVSRTDNNGLTALAAAFWDLPYADNRNHDRLEQVCEALLAKGIDINATYRFPSSAAMLFDHVPEAADFDDVQSQYVKLCGDVQVSLLILAIWRNNLKAAKYLLTRGALINLSDSHNCTPLMHAVRVNNLTMIKLLLDPEYDPDVEKAQIEVEKRQAAEANKLYSEEEKMASETDNSSDSDWSPKPSGSRKRVLNRRRSNIRVKRPCGNRRTFQLVKVLVNNDEAKKPAMKTKTISKLLDVDDIDLEFRPFKKVSRLEVNNIDSDGWSVIHHLVAPLDYGTYDNVEILVLLHSNGALLNISNHDRLSPLDLALRHGALKLAKALQKLTGIAKKSWKAPSLEKVVVNDGVPWSVGTLDYKRDAELMLKQIDAKKGPPKDALDPVHVPDDSLNFKDGEVVMDDDLKVHYDVMLSKIDVGKGQWGLYNFYKMQVVHDKTRDLYVLFNRWGRIGDAGQYQKTPFATKMETIKEFMKIFRAKTGNKWSDVKSFEKKEKKYQLVDVDRQPRRRHLNPIEFSLQSKHASRLPQEVQSIMKDVTDVTGLQTTMRNMAFDMDNTPLGRIKAETIHKALDILKEIEVIVNRMEARTHQQSVDNSSDVAVEAEQVAELTNEYYHLMPKGGYAFERLCPLYRSSSLRSEKAHLEDLLHVQLASSILAGAEFRLKEMNPFDYVYRNMGVRIRQLAEDDMEAQFLLKYIHSSVSKPCRYGQYVNYKILGLYSVCRPGEQERLLAANYSDHKLLFHGTKVANLISILTRGLLTENNIAHSTGSAYGKGLYLADKFTKSASYCHNFNKDSSVLYMLVCQVGLGCVKKAVQGLEDDKKRPKEYDTMWALGNLGPDPQYNVMLPTGACIPLGNVKPAEYEGFPQYYYNQDSEYVVQNNDQICMRYLIQYQRE